MRKLTLFVLVFVAINASAKADCEFDLGAPFTTSVEWEYQPLPKEHDPDAKARALAAALGYGGGVAEYLFETRFKELFSFYGREQDGVWVKGLIPKSVGPNGWPKLVNRKLQERGGNYYLPDWENADAELFAEILNGAMAKRGQFNEDLKLRKNPGAWKKYGLDRLVPEEVSEEWKNGKFLTIEFPLAGKVRSEAEFRAYLTHLWGRLGILPADPKERVYALDNTAGHVHWVPNIQRVPREKRKVFYQAVIGFWGSQNDQMSVSYAADQFDPGDYAERIDLRSSVSAFRWMLNGLINYSLLPLSRSVYELPQSSPEGIFIEDKSRIDPWVDANFSPEMKRTGMGLRSIYDLNRGVSAGVVVHPGLESRLRRTTRDNWNSLPVHALDNEAQLNLFLQNAVEGPRGLPDDPMELAMMVYKAGLNADFFAEVYSGSKMGEPYDEKFKPEIRLAFKLIPLFEWENHPAVKFNLARMAPRAREAALKKLISAREAWLTAMKNFMRARAQKDFNYIPIWNMNDDEKKFFAVNRFFLTGEDHAPGNDGLEMKMGINLHPVRLFQIAYAGEFMRFIDASGLASLLRPPGIR